MLPVAAHHESRVSPQGEGTVEAVTYPDTDTVVTYPAGSTESDGTVVHVETLADGRLVVLLDRTAAHPVDTTWPDQGSDRSTISTSAGETPVLESVVAATDGSALYVGTDIPVKKGTPGWAFVAAHLMRPDTSLVEGDAVHVTVDPAYRHALSAGHTACHLASLALNSALAGAWKKDVMTDALGQPNFDALAIERSTIVENGSEDVYRIGKSLRRKGFAADALGDLPVLEEAINATLAEWVATDAPARIDSDGDGLTDRRYWVCDLPGTAVRIPCGGTHLASLAEVSSLGVTLHREETDGAVILTMLTTSSS